jgi:hypothetical protein
MFFFAILTKGIIGTIFFFLPLPQCFIGVVVVFFPSVKIVGFG